MLRVTERAKGAEGIGKSAIPNRNSTPPTLAELGITKTGGAGGTFSSGKFAGWKTQP